jgi:hypothetical protein
MYAAAAGRLAQVVDDAARAVIAYATGGWEHAMANLIGGLIAMAIAFGYLGIIAARVDSLPLWIVVLIGMAMMAWSFYESLRGDENG